MYEKFFGFQRPPFELVPDPDFLFLGESHDSALANLVVGIESGKGFVAISGPVGTGKTTVLRALLRRLGRGEKVCFLAQPELETSDLLRAILDGFGIVPEGDDVAHLRRALRETMHASDVPGILIIDEAHLLSEESLEQIRLLSNLEEDDRKLLQIILSGQPELKAVLSSERLRPLAQRIEMFYEIRPLDRADTHAYVDRRLRIAGNPAELAFDSRAVDLIHDCAGGIPRLINVLADRALITAYVGETHRVTEDLVASAYEDLGEISQAVMPGSPRTGRHRMRRPRVQPVETRPSARTEPEVAPRENAPPRPKRVLPSPLVPLRLMPEPESNDEGAVPVPPSREATQQGAAPAPAPRPEPVTERAAPARSEPRPETETPVAPRFGSEPAPVPVDEVPARAPAPVALVQEPAAPEPGSRVIADWEQRRPEPKQRAVAPTRRVRHPIDRDRWLAGVGLAAIVILAGVSLGSRYLFDATRLEPRASDSPAAGGAPPESAAVRSARPASGAGVASAPTEAVPAAPPPVVVATPPSDTWSIQVASFRTTDRANRLADQLRGETGERVTVSSVNGESGIWYRVLVGEYATREEVATRMEELRTQYDFGFLRRVRVRSGEVAR